MSDDPEVGELLALVDKLEALLENSDLSEIEVEAAGTTLVLRKPVAVARRQHSEAGPRQRSCRTLRRGRWRHCDPGAAGSARTGLHAVVAPLTGGTSTSRLTRRRALRKVGGHRQSGQVIGLIEAMKLFNEIKSDVIGTVRRIAAETGALVKAKQPLIEVEPIDEQGTEGRQ